VDNIEDIAGRVERLIAAARRWASTREDLGYQVGIGLSHIDREAEITAWAAFREAAIVLRTCLQPEAAHAAPEDVG
jgi:hypothetical protein